MARFTDRTIEEIKQRLTISDVMRNYAQIEYRGGKSWVKCPFHGGGNEKTASCILDDSEGRYYCFGCHASGDIFTLVKEKEGLDFPSAVEELAKRAGVQLVESSEKSNRSSDEKNMLYDVYSRISKTFHYLLINNPEAQEAREYLEKRHVSHEMIDTFQLGYAPKNPRWLYGFLKSKDYSDVFLKKSGLFSQNYEGYSLFSNRLIFPIRDRNGRVLAFSGRDLSGNSKAKYINSPETMIYQKKDNFFGIFEAKKSIASKISPILCEGNFDVVAMHQAGYTSAIASLGTAFTKEQCDSITRFFPAVKEFDLLFDSDEAGQRESEKAILLLHSKGLKSYVHRFSSAKDASELLQNSGKEGVDKEFLPKQDDFEYLVQRAGNIYDIQEAKGKSDFIKYLSGFILSSASYVERDGYILKLSSMLGISEESIWRDLKPSEAPSGEYPESIVEEESFAIGRRTYDYFAMLFLASNREDFAAYRNKLKLGDLEDNRAKAIYIALENAMRNDIRTPELFLSLITDEKIRNDVAISFAQKEFEDANKDALDEAIMHINLRSMEKQREILTRQLKLLSDTAEQDEAIVLLQKKQEVDNNIRRLREGISKNNLAEA